MNDWWTEFLSEDVSEDTFTTEQKSLFHTYQVSLDQKRLFRSTEPVVTSFFPNLLQMKK